MYPTQVEYVCVAVTDRCSYLKVPQPIFSITASRQLNSAEADARQNMAIMT